MWKRPIIIGGISLPIRISWMRSGETISWSKVPSSRSRAIDSAVTIRPISSAMLAIRFGTMNHW